MALKLPQPTFGWDRNYQIRLNQTAEAEDVRNRKIGTNIELGATERLIVRSPDGTRWFLTVADDGTVGATSI